jgi:hypothetical protein
MTEKNLKRTEGESEESWTARNVRASALYEQEIDNLIGAAVKTVITIERIPGVDGEPGKVVGTQEMTRPNGKVETRVNEFISYSRCLVSLSDHLRSTLEVVTALLTLSELTGESEAEIMAGYEKFVAGTNADAATARTPEAAS